MIQIRITLKSRVFYQKTSALHRPYGAIFLDINMYLDKQIKPMFLYGIGVRLDHIDLSHPIHLPVDYEYMQHDMTLQYILRDSW